MSDPKVWISSRMSGRKRRYSLRWIDTSLGKWQSIPVGTDYKRAQCERVALEKKMADGTFRALKRTEWDAFAAEIVGYLSGLHADEAFSVLTEFGGMMKVVSPNKVRHSTIRNYVQQLRARGNAVATINKKCRYLRLAFREAVRSDYCKVNPMDGWIWLMEPRHALRILTPVEEAKLLPKAGEMYGFQMTLFVRFVLATWARLAEATRLQWADVNFDDESVYFRNTKSHEDRFIPMDSHRVLLADLHKLKAKTLQDGGPFVAFRDKSNLHKKWARIIKAAEIPAVTIHDLRRTGITRALLAGMPSVVVQKLAGHKSITTTVKYYTEVSKADLREAVKRLAARG